ncbi:MAG: sugar phosphate isomerase/epimerase [Acidobacteriota bacterium]|nr:sugar phosphate isomerase/epimerase [Acidobacteriota bacterium]
MNRRKFFLSATASAAAAFVVPCPASASEPVNPGFHLGCITYNTLKEFDVDTIIRILESAGFEGVELRTGHKHGVEPSIGPEERARVRQRFARSKIRLVSYGTTCRFQSPDPAERERQLVVARQFVDLARDTGALGIKIQPMGFPEGVPKETTIQNFGGSLHELGDYSAGKNVEIWMEVHGRGTSDPPVAAAIVKAAAHKNVGLCWNSNDTDVRNGSVKESFELLAPYIRSVHINELTNEQYPWRELFGLLRGIHYNRYTFAEVAESKDPERFLRWYRALWMEMNRSCG